MMGHSLVFGKGNFITRIVIKFLTKVLREILKILCVRLVNTGSASVKIPHDTATVTMLGMLNIGSQTVLQWV